MNLKSALLLKKTEDLIPFTDLTIHLLQKPMSDLTPLTHSHVLKSRDNEERALIHKYSDGTLMIDYFDCGLFYLKKKDLYVYNPHPEFDFFIAILTTQILPLASSLFRVTLHGGVAIKNGKALIYLGQEGAGKSTLTTFLAQNGFTIFSDDTAAIDSQLCVHAGLPETRLNDDSCHALLNKQEIPHLPRKLAKQQIHLLPHENKKFPISELFILNPTRNSGVRKRTPLTMSEGFSTLIQNQFRWDLWNTQILQREFQTLAELCQKKSLIKLSYPKTFANLPWIMQQMERSPDECFENHPRL